MKILREYKTMGLGFTILFFAISLFFAPYSYSSNYRDNEIISILKRGEKFDFTLSNTGIKAPVIKCIINNTHESLCIFDTGSSFDVIIKESAVKKYGLGNLLNGKMNINGVSQNIKYGKIDNLQLSGYSNETKLDLGARYFLVLKDSESIFDFIRHNNKPIDIIVSLNSQLEAIIIQIDYINQRIGVMNNTEYTDYSKAKKVELRVRNNIPKLIKKSAQGNEYEFTLDTGGNFVILPKDIINESTIERVIRDAEITGINRERDAKFVVIKNFIIGELELKNIGVCYQETINKFIFGYPGMKDTVVTIDKNKGYVFFESASRK